MNIKNLVSVTKTSAVLGALAFSFAFSANAATDATPITSSDSANAPAARHYLFDPVEITPVTGFIAVDGKGAFNVGAHGAYPLLSNALLYVEPSLMLGFFASFTSINPNAGLRYDITLPDTKVRPFAHLSVGPAFQTSGSVAVFTGSFGGGAIIPITNKVEFRAEADLVNYDGKAGIQITAGVSI